MTEPRSPQTGSRQTRQYSRLVGVAFLAFIVFMAVRIIDSNKQGGTGLAKGEAAPKFAAPSATGDLRGDANIFQNARQAKREGSEHARAACQVTARDAIRVCDYFDKPLVMVVWFTRCGNCEEQLDVVDRLRDRYPRVNFLAVDVADTVDNAGRLVRKNDWHFPMAVDTDGAVSRLYNVGVGPTTFFILPGGVVWHTALGKLSRRLLAEDIDSLLREARRERRS